MKDLPTPLFDTLEHNQAKAPPFSGIIPHATSDIDVELRARHASGKKKLIKPV